MEQEFFDFANDNDVVETIDWLDEKMKSINELISDELDDFDMEQHEKDLNEWRRFSREYFRDRSQAEQTPIYITVNNKIVQCGTIGLVNECVYDIDRQKCKHDEYEIKNIHDERMKCVRSEIDAEIEKKILGKEKHKKKVKDNIKRHFNSIEAKNKKVNENMEQEIVERAKASSKVSKMFNILKKNK